MRRIRTLRLDRPDTSARVIAGRCRGQSRIEIRWPIRIVRIESLRRTGTVSEFRIAQVFWARSRYARRIGFDYHDDHALR